MTALNTSGSAADQELERLAQMSPRTLAAALVGVREQLRQAEQELGARQKPREEGESDRLSGALETERELRREWWLNHGHEFAALYGDDGEMQCGECRVDFKRAPLDDVRAAVRKARLKRAADFWAGTPTGDPAASPELARELAALRVERDAAVEALREIAIPKSVPEHFDPLDWWRYTACKRGEIARDALGITAEEALAGSYTEGGTPT